VTAVTPARARGEQDSVRVPWGFPAGERGWDRRGQLLDGEAAAIIALGPGGLRRRRAVGIPRLTARHWTALARLAEPLDAARAALHHGDDCRFRRAGAVAAAIVLQHCADTGRSYWAWAEWEWAGLCGPGPAEFLAAQALPAEPTARPVLAALGYLLGGFTGFQHLGTFNRSNLARMVFGGDAVEGAIGQAAGILAQWGYQDPQRSGHRMRGTVSHVLLVNRSPRLEDLTTEAFAALHAHPATTSAYSPMLYALQRAAAALGTCDPPPRPGLGHGPGIQGTDPEWAQWVERWHATSTLSPKVRVIARSSLAKAGRWLAAEQPQITSPAQWTRQTCAAWVAAVDRMAVGDYTQRRGHREPRTGKPVSPRTKAHILNATRAFFRDCQEWEWIPRRFDPVRALGIPRSVRALISTSPRVIADAVWAKLMGAGLSLQAADLPVNSAGLYYPVELTRAVTLTWLFAGLRSDEIFRLRVGCIRWQHDGQPILGDSADVLAGDAVCLLDVPVHKTGTAFTKPIDPIAGQAIEAWQALRPAQPARLDRKTGEHADILFSVRAQPVARDYINRTIIPALCAKAGVPAADVRGNITSHRARSTIATQLYNAKEPMTLFELQAWLGHRDPSTTQHYAKITPNTLTKAYTQAGYFARNIRTIEILLDRDAVTSGAAAAGQPWQHYDLGHGYCSYTFFEQCPHRMACARCDFYTPKDSSQAQLLEAKANLQHMLASIPLTDDERAAVEDGHAALDALLSQLADIPTPAGPTPRQTGVSPSATLLPIIGVRHGKTDNGGQI
jgi:integrase